MRRASRSGMTRPLGKLALAGDVQAVRAQAGAQQQTRQHAGEEQGGHRHRAAGRHRVDDRVVARRDQDRLHRTADRDGGREAARVAVLFHLGNQHRADRGRVGHRRAGDGAEECRGQDVDQRQTAANEADQHAGERHQPARHAALGHDGAGQHEAGDGQQRELVDAAGDLDHHAVERKVDPPGADQRGQTEREGDRHADQHEDREAAEQHQCVHVRSPGRWRGLLMVERDHGAVVLRPRQGVLEHEQQDQEAADRQRQVGVADGQPGQVRQRLAHRLHRQLRAPDHHEQADADHQHIDQLRAHPLQALGQLVGQHADGDVAGGPVRGGRAEEREGHHQQDRDRLRPARSGSEHVAGIDAPGNDQAHRQDGDARYPDAREVDAVQQTVKCLGHGDSCRAHCAAVGSREAAGGRPRARRGVPT